MAHEIKSKRVVTCKRDETLFKKGIQNWLMMGQDRPTWNQFLYDLVVKVNREAGTLKYCYFNDRQQRIFLTNAFESWATNLRETMKATIKQYYA